MTSINKQGDDDTMTREEAGAMGGHKVAAERGPEFYSEIGQMQGKETNPGNFANRPKKDAQMAGEKGGRSNTDGLAQHDIDDD